MTYEAVDEAFERLEGLGVEANTGSPNHGPMAVEALVALGHDDAVNAWIGDYAKKLNPAPAPAEPVTSQTWRAALGARHRFADWKVHIRRELTTMTWQDVVTSWTRRLLPGTMAAGMHGPIRTAHAIRALENAETGVRLDELASAIGYWASYYQRLPGTPQLTGAGAVDIDAALRGIPRLDEQKRRSGPPPYVVRFLADLPDFTEVVDLAPAPADMSGALRDLSMAGARLYRENAASYPLVFIHTITITEALRSLLRYIPMAVHGIAYSFVWQCVAALTAAFATSAPAGADELVPPSSVTEVIDRCVETGDEHAFKLTAACVREYERSHDPAFLAVADDWNTKMLNARGWDRDRLRAAGLAF